MVEILDVCNISSNCDFIVFKICVTSEQKNWRQKTCFSSLLNTYPLRKFPATLRRYKTWDWNFAILLLVL